MAWLNFGPTPLTSRSALAGASRMAVDVPKRASSDLRVRGPTPGTSERSTASARATSPLEASRVRSLLPVGWPLPISPSFTVVREASPAIGGEFRARVHDRQQFRCHAAGCQNLMHIGFGTGTASLTGCNMPDCVSMRKTLMLSPSRLPTSIHRPVGSILKLRGVLMPEP